MNTEEKKTMKKLLRSSYDSFIAAKKELIEALHSDFYKNRKKYEDRIVDYPDSPTGKAYVGINKAPFMKNDTGYGYQGVLLQDDTRSFIQCSGCGKWAKILTHAHIKKCLGINHKEYKERFGLNQNTGLISDVVSLKYTKQILDGKFKNSKKTYDITSAKRVKNKRTRQMENKHGTCPLQLKHRTYEFIIINRELPSQRNRGKNLRSALIRRHGNFNNALENLGLPVLDRRGDLMRYIFPDGSIHQYSVQRFYDREELYRQIIDKCPEIQKYIKENNITNI